MLRDFARQAVVRPFALLLRNPSVLAVAGVVLAFSLLVPDQGIATDVFRRGWLFDDAPAEAWSLIRSPAFLAVAAGGFAGKILVSAAASQQLMLVFRDRRTTLFATLRSIRVGSVCWLFGAELALYVLCALAGLLGYLPALLVWRTAGADLTIPLLAVAVLAFPAAYAAVSAAIVAAPLPVSVRERSSVVAAMRERRIFLPLYGLFAVRVILETMLLGVAPLVLLDVVHNKPLATLAVGAGVLAPSLLLRGSCYALMLYALRPVPVIERVFGPYFADSEPVGAR
ncbi:hypothetical protein [Amycolatopsis sp. Poz14]|uniref:hypothetical protein n=1 Tax=Amycolatopsis sp. Poz14 TaxID=1447705 RepID=UPI001EE873B7|nr:hypothetical protein [Amycolatopsis sp. Poz14]MCG3754363.1 hypothetical protein [Amycolatopsis sp. Poz14]